jgi:hypothetical protein
MPSQTTITPLPPPPGMDPQQFAPVGLAPTPADARKEYISGGARDALTNTPQALQRTIDDLTWEFGVRVYETMMLDPKVAASVNYLKSASLTGGIRVIPSILAPPERKEPDPDAPSAADVAKAKEVATFCQWNLRRLDRPLEETLREMLDALPYGHKLAEQTYEVAPDEDYEGKLALRSVKPKARETWSYVVDPWMNVLGIRPEMGAAPEAGMQLLPREKFAILAWDPRNGDPRGTSILRPAYEAWNLKTKMFPGYYQFTQTFASPNVIGKVGKDSPDVPVTDVPAYKGPADGGFLSAAQVMGWQLERFANARWLVVNGDDEVTLVYPTTKGEAHLAGFDFANREIVSAILGTTTGTEEALHDSRAISQTGQDTIGLLVRRIKGVLARLVEWDLLWNLVRYNYGRDVADKFTPTVTLGDIEHQDFAATGATCASLRTAGILKPNQDDWILQNKLGMTEIPDGEEPEPPPQLAAVGPDGKPLADGQQAPPGKQPPTKADQVPPARSKPPADKEAA